MNTSSPSILQNRRRFLRGLGLGTALFTVPGAFAEELVRTPRQTEGPFYPDHLPLDTDNDLIIVNDGITPAIGEITHLSGRILDGRGDPIRNALVEIWQVDNNGVYLHSRDTHAQRDINFQGFGRFLTGSSGRILFSHHQASSLSRAHAPHPLCRQDERTREMDHAMLRQR